MNDYEPTLEELLSEPEPRWSNVKALGVCLLLAVLLMVALVLIGLMAGTFYTCLAWGFDLATP